MDMQDISSNMFGILSGIAQATGGLTESSANVSSMFEKASAATENYYLLYYTPKDYTMDGKYKTIEVKVKDRNYRITHRQGYFAN
jgi:VWFA-related protein